MFWFRSDRDWIKSSHFSGLKCELCEGKHLRVGWHSREGPEPQIKLKELNQTHIQRSEAPAPPTGPQAAAEFFQGNEPFCSGVQIIATVLGSNLAILIKMKKT